MREFSIFQAVCDGRVYGALKWFKQADAETIRPHVASATLLQELGHCSADDLDLLANGIRHILLDGEIDATPEKESLLFLLFLKAQSVHAGFQGALRPLGVRCAVIQSRLREHDPETVIGDEERYCGMGLRLCAAESLHWHEHMSAEYAEPLLISEILTFLLNNDIQTRQTQYERALRRVLTKKEADLLAGYAASRAAFSQNWLNDYKAYGELLRWPTEAKLQTEIDAYLASLPRPPSAPG